MFFLQDEIYHNGVLNGFMKKEKLIIAHEVLGSVFMVIGFIWDDSCIFVLKIIN